MFETLKLILAEILHKQPEEIRMEMDLREDLAATDIDIMRMLIDAAFEFEILDEELSIDGF